ncbi:neuronal membrane glycoprotein M6-b-like [Scaptodrosophila lebanonensis]|uniref:Neuronal membrane glycoprotein M6-b-like n=1 Tax=Drosophila lebanonensis TaxID=7225 RepID=A0A6J2TPV6_DROLE|nr:neuronal membrane glycoprotein M6-b-like [Scaptodrosophila lebanonensis]
MRDCKGRIPYCSLLATIVCLFGVGVFGLTMNFGASQMLVMVNEVFHLRPLWIGAVQMLFNIVAIGTAALGFMILFLGFLTTGATRYRAYRARHSRVGGRKACAVFMGITYILSIVWTLILCFLVIGAFITTCFWKMCTSLQNYTECIDVTQFHFWFPPHTKLEDMKVCGRIELNAFCKDGVESSTSLILLATLATLLIQMSLVHYLICLSANYAHIRDHEKFQELQDIQNLNELESSATSNDRF